MTDSKKERTPLDRLKQALVDDVLQETDLEILEEFSEQHGSPDATAIQMGALFEKTVLIANKQRLAAARAGAVDAKGIETTVSLPIAEARAVLHRTLAAHADDDRFTLAARKETELSDSDVLDMLQAMKELGLLD
jgi:hypothetical protein